MYNSNLIHIYKGKKILFCESGRGILRVHNYCARAHYYHGQGWIKA